MIVNKLITGIAVFLLATTAGAQRDPGFGDLAWPADGNVVIPVAEADTLGGLAATLNQRADGVIAAAAEEADFTGAAGKTLTLYGIGPYARVDLVGVGPDRLDRVDAENYGGTAATLNDGKSGTATHILWGEVEREADATAARVALGFRLGDYRFDRYHEDRVDTAARGGVTIRSNDDNAAAQFRDDLVHVADAIYLARDLVTEPGNVVYPQSFVDRVRRAFRGVDGVKIKVLDEHDLERLGMGAHHGVGGGSMRKPRLLIVEYLTGGDAPLVALAGKGITFDTGGVSLKRNQDMWRMKGDMAGAAVVSATVLAAARRGARVNVVALAALAENMPSGTAIRPGDVLTSMSGKTIEINSTDAEGRLVLADAVHYAQQHYSPEVLIDVATLTGSVFRAVGDTYAGLFSRHDDLAQSLLDASAAAGEPAWRLPLDDVHFELIESKVADVINGGISGAGASIGAAFIGSFVAPEQRWAHFDIASVDYIERPEPTRPLGFSAWGIRALDEYLRRDHEARR